MILVSALGAAAIGATLALFFVANARLRSANTASARAATVSAAAFDVRAAVVSIDVALQQVVEEYSAKNLAQWRHAERSWEQPAAALEQAAAASNDQQERRTHALRDEIRSYIDDYGEPVVGIAKVSPAAVRSSVAHTEGTLRLERNVDAFVEAQSLAGWTGVATSTGNGGAAACDPCPPPAACP